MRKIYVLTSLFLFCCVQMANAQDYIPFPTSNAMWREYSSSFEGHCYDYQYLITGDTIINGLIYHKLHLSGVEYPYSGWDECNMNAGREINYYAGCFRNDTLAKKVYLYGEPEKLIYDFSLSVGDTIPTLFLNDLDPKYCRVVLSIDSIELGGIYRKRFLITNGVYIIEGMGSTYGLLPEYCPFESILYLKCFSINEETIYPAGGGYCAPAYLAIEDYHHDRNRITLYPNPAYSTFQIKGIGDFQNVTISVYNMYGQIVMHERIVNKDESIHIEDLCKGVYMVNISSKNSMVTTCKLIKL